MNFWNETSSTVLTTIAVGVGASVVTLVVARTMARRRRAAPARALVDALQKMTAGDWAVRVDPDGSDDMRQAGRQVNLLGDAARKQFDMLRHQQADLQALVDMLPDPILLADAQQRIVLINSPAAALLDLAPARAAGQKVASVVHDEAILNVTDRLYVRPDASVARSSENGFHDAREDLGRATGIAARPTSSGLIEPARSVQCEINLVRSAQRVTYEAFATRTVGGGMLLVLRDVSTLAGAVQMKTDFVANASHELRTPIAAIKIAFETLREVYQDDAMQAEKCVNIIDGHLRRLEEMLADLLDLSRVEQPDIQPQVTSIPTGDIFSLLRSTLGAMARQKIVELDLRDTPSTPEAFATDGRLLNLVLKNLVENSIKFTPTGGSVAVTIEYADADESEQNAERSEPHAPALPNVIVTVADTGIGIAPEHLDRVFERFYQVDPARSGSAGRGTGLGLAIVKHAVHALDGTLQVRSTVGEGTTVACSLPQRQTGTRTGATPDAS